MSASKGLESRRVFIESRWNVLSMRGLFVYVCNVVKQLNVAICLSKNLDHIQTLMLTAIRNLNINVNEL